MSGERGTRHVASADFPDFLTGGGQMGTLTRTHDWARTPLGPLDAWPPSLRKAVGIVLGSPAPTWLAWGPELVVLYNDGYIPIFGALHPAIFGQSAGVGFAEFWHWLGPLFETVLSGEVVTLKDYDWTFERRGQPEMCCITTRFSAVRDEAGHAAGVLCLSFDTTPQTRLERRLRFLVDLGNHLRGLAGPHEVMAAAAERLGRHLGAGRAGYGEVEETGAFFTVEHDWTDGTMQSIAGRHRLDDFGPPIIDELRAGRTIRLDDALADPRTAVADSAAAFAAISKRAGIAAPLMHDGRVVAALYVHEAAPRRWRDDEVALTEEVAQRTWEAVGRARAEVALRKSEAGFRALAEAVPHLVWSSSAEGAADYFNSRWRAYTGLTDRESYGQGWEYAIHPDDLPPTQESWAQGLRTGDAVEIENRVRRADGCYRWHVTRAAPLRDGEGRVVRWYGTATDIHDRKVAEEEHRRLSEVIRQTPYFVVISDAQLRPVFLNEAARRISGLEGADVSQVAIADFFHPDDQALIRDVALPALLRDGAWEGEVRFRHFGGGPDFPVRWRAFTLHGGDGSLLGAATITTDISERKRVETALRESEARLQAAIDLVGLSLYTWDPRTNALRWDQGVKAMWGLPAKTPVDYGIWLNGIHPDDRERVEAAAARSIDPDGDGVYAMEYRVIGLTDGVERWVSTYGRTLFEKGQPVWFTGAALDVTERKHADERLRESEERFRQFAENSTDVLWIMDVEANRLEYLSPAFELVWGESRDIMLRDGSRWTEILHPEDRELVLNAVARALAGEGVAPEYRIVRADGFVRWIRNRVFPIPDEKGKVRRIGGIAQDITRHKGALVYAVDGDKDTRDALASALHGGGYEVKTFASVRAFLEAAPVLVPGCVLLDTRALDAGGLAVLKQLKTRRITLPVIVTGECHGDVGLAVQIIKAGAVDYLEMPYGREALLAAVASALADVHDATARDRAADLAQARIAEMSSREREVLDRLFAGGTNKTIAKDLGISPRTVEVHRAHVMQRLGAETLPEAVLMAAAAGLQLPPPRPASDPDQA